MSISDLIKTPKVIGGIILIILGLIFTVIYFVNSNVQEGKNTHVEVNEINAPDPDDADANCLRVDSKPCPPKSK